MKPPVYYRQIAPNYYVLGAKKVGPKAPLAGVILALFAVLLTSLDLLAAAPSQPASRPADDPHITALVKQLGSDEAGARESAMKQLLAIGAAARPALLKAIGSDDPGLRDEAGQILLRLPWYLPDDPDAVRDALSRYGTTDITIRRQVVDNLANIGQPALPALYRLLGEDPSPGVRWTIVARLREMDQGPQLARFRTVEPWDDPPMLALCGYARLAVDPPGARRLLQRCADLEFANPSDDDGEFDVVVAALSQLACQQKQFDLAAQLRRQELGRGSQSDESGISTALLELFALHGEYGPLAGLKDDLKLAGPAATSAKIQYCLSRAYANAGNAAAAIDARERAFAASTSRRQRYFVGQFLYHHGWNELAEAELTQFLKIRPDPDNVDPDVSDAVAHILLGELAAQRGDDLAAAQHDELALPGLGQVETTDASGHRRPMQFRDIRAKIDWYTLHAALTSHDQAKVSQMLDELVALKPDDTDIVIEVVPVLRQAGRSADANALFNGAFKTIKDQLDADPNNASLLNDAAWLCARCDQRLYDALGWASKAAADMPADPAILDTLAEVDFHLGRAGQAVQLESRATELDPQDTFMAAQLKRFRAAADSRPSPSTSPN
jgi:tetratricopeptide (TPR) repeat protein